MNNVLAVTVGGALLLLGSIWIRDQRTREAPKPDAPNPTITRDSWIPFQAGTFRQSAVEIGESVRLAADTRGTPPGTWQHLGARRRHPIQLREGVRISATLQWPVIDSSSLTASVVLSPHFVSHDPRSADSWTELAWLGTGPGSGRLILRSRVDGADSTDYSEGSASLDIGGRPISRVRLGVSVSNGRMLFVEDGRTRAELKFSSTEARFLYFVLSSDSNFPLREVRFTDVELVEP